MAAYKGGHVPGYRYLFESQGTQTVQASPSVKVLRHSGLSNIWLLSPILHHCFFFGFGEARRAQIPLLIIANSHF